MRTGGCRRRIPGASQREEVAMQPAPAQCRPPPRCRAAWPRPRTQQLASPAACLQRQAWKAPQLPAHTHQLRWSEISFSISIAPFAVASDPGGLGSAGPAAGFIPSATTAPGAGPSEGDIIATVNATISAHNKNFRALEARAALCTSSSPDCRRRRANPPRTPITA